MITIEKKSVNLDIHIVELLAPMGHISVKEGNLYKDGKKFGMLRENQIYLLTNSSQFLKLNDDITDNPDELLQLATKAYWIASGKI